MKFFHLPPREEGQGLVEYGLTLMLVAVVIVGILTLFGDSVKATYCRTTHQISPDADLSGPCSAPILMPDLVSQGPNHINIEVQIHDPDGDPNNPYAAITQVEFYMDDTNSGPVHTEYHYRYCLGSNSGLNPCNNYNISGLANGGHTVIILAYDNDGNVGSARYAFSK